MTTILKKDRKLTIKQENFCNLVAAGMSLSDAYRSSFNSKGRQSTINEAASRLNADTRIIKRIVSIREPVIKEARITLSDHISELQELRDMAKIDKKWGSAIQAEVSIGKVCGLYVEKVELSNKNGESFKHSVDLSLLSDAELITFIALREKIEK